jgi:hypothetical protein
VSSPFTFAEKSNTEAARTDERRAVTGLVTGIWEHYDEHAACKEWSSYGYQIGRQTAHWFCREHRDDGERMIGRA